MSSPFKGRGRFVHDFSFFFSKKKRKMFDNIIFCFLKLEAHLWRFLKAMSENAKSGVFFSQSNFRGYIICVTAKKSSKNCKLSSNYNCTFSHYCIVNTNGISTDFGGKSSVHHLQKCSAGPSSRE